MGHTTEQEKKTDARKDIIKEQERLLEEASANLQKQKQNEEQMELAEKTSTLPLNSSNQTTQFFNQLENIKQLGNQNNEELETKIQTKVPTPKTSTTTEITPKLAVTTTNQTSQFLK